MIKEKLRYSYKGLMSQVFVPIIIVLTIIKNFYNMDNEFIFVTGILCLSITVLLFTMSMIKVDNEEVGSLKLIGRGYFFIAILGFVFGEDAYLINNINLSTTFFQILIFLTLINILVSIIIYYRKYSSMIHWAFLLLLIPLMFFIMKSQCNNLKYANYFFQSKIGLITNLLFGILIFLSILYSYKRFNLTKNKEWILEISFFMILSNIFLFLALYYKKDLSYFIWTSNLISCFILYNEFEKKLLYNLYANAYESLNKAKEIKKNLNKSLKSREKDLKDLNLLLKKSEKKYKDVVQAFSKGLLVFENDILVYSYYFQEIFDIKDINMKYKKNKITLNEILNKITGEIYIDNEKNKEFSAEVKLKDKFGKLRDYDMCLINIKENKKILVFFEVTEIIKQRKELVKIEKKLKEENINEGFYSNISHELRTPINVIYSALQLNDIYLKDNKIDKINKNNQIIKQNCLRLIRTINNFIDSNKLSEGFLESDIKTYNIVDIIENVILSCDNYMKLKKNNLIYDPQFEEIYLNFDKDHMERIMLNILSNSLKYGKENGNIYISIKIENDNIIIEVLNDAETIPKDKRNEIFEKFTKVNASFSRPSEGSGLGLYLTKGLVNLHKGEITISAGPKYGNLYKIVLPYNKNLKAKDSCLSHDMTINELQQKIDIEFSDIYF
ncbi:HAMP domain-containing sensor histidine kinase [Clostridium sp.]|uniref:sensor histidine kinase n=1 Tax=Clostridium sp. TaxID=1506 RepID=UPI002908BD1C|nr:HAMP domain-containing sensor histidine kinase [Clostridium sp.]MDU5107171.1 HAMP domain-containing sensor histidine kinase [Clostridium sp.]